MIKFKRKFKFSARLFRYDFNETETSRDIRTIQQADFNKSEQERWSLCPTVSVTPRSGLLLNYTGIGGSWSGDILIFAWWKYLISSSLYIYFPAVLRVISVSQDCGNWVPIHYDQLPGSFLSTVKSGIHYSWTVFFMEHQNKIIELIQTF